MTALDDIEQVDFTVRFADGVSKNYISEDDLQYQWATGPDGTLFLYRKEINVMFGVTTKDARIGAYTSGFWQAVDVIPKPEKPKVALEEADSTKNVVKLLAKPKPVSQPGNEAEEINGD